MKNNYSEPFQFLAKQEMDKFLNDESPSMPIQAFFTDQNLQNLCKVGVSVISEMIKSQNLDASVPYKAINLFCRFISKHKLPRMGNADVNYRIHVIAMSCLRLSLTIKDGLSKRKSLMGFWLDQSAYSRDVIKFEAFILEVLGQSSDSITALSFVANFLSESELILKRKVCKLIVHSGEDISFMRFKPSVIAASAILVTCPTTDLSQYREKFTGEYARMDVDELDACVHLMDEFGKIALDNDELSGDYGSSLMDFDVKWMSDESWIIDPSLFLEVEDEEAATVEAEQEFVAEVEEVEESVEAEAEEEFVAEVKELDESVVKFLRFCCRALDN